MMASDPENVPFTLIAISDDGTMTFQVVRGQKELFSAIEEWGLGPISPKQDYEPQPGYLAQDRQGDPVLICRGLPTKLNFHLSIAPYEPPQEKVPPAPLKKKGQRERIAKELGADDQTPESREISDDWD